MKLRYPLSIKNKVIRISFGILIGIILLFFVGKVGSYIKVSNSEAFEFVKDSLASDGRITDKIGTIRKFGFASGSIRKKEAEVRTKIYGTNSEFNVIVFLKKTNDEWFITRVKYVD